MTQTEPDDGHLSDCEVQSRLYEIASDARLGTQAINGIVQSGIDQMDDDDLLAIERLFQRIESCRRSRLHSEGKFANHL